MDKLVKLNNQTIFRDRLARLIQFASRMVWDITEKNDLLNKISIGKLKLLEHHIAMFRRLLRLGRCIDSLYATLPLLHYPDKVIQTLAVLTKISQAMYLLCDHILWFGRVGIKDVNTLHWGDTANRYYFYSIVLLLLRDLYEIFQMYNVLKSSHKKVPMTQLVLNNTTLCLDILKNTCDVFIPATALGLVKCSPCTVGLFGVLSSAVMIYTIVNPQYKLVP